MSRLSEADRASRIAVVLVLFAGVGGALLWGLNEVTDQYQDELSPSDGGWAEWLWPHLLPSVALLLGLGLLATSVGIASRGLADDARDTADAEDGDAAGADDRRTERAVVAVALLVIAVMLLWLIVARYR